MTELLFIVEEDPTGGLTARAVGHGIFTEGETREDLIANVREAVQCHFAETAERPKSIRLHYVRDEVLAP
jgi:hypothetical protein